MTAPAFNPADLWERLVHRGVSKADATKHVLLTVGNLPEKVQADYLKDVDPGKLASFGLGAADMMSFGLGDQAARAVLGKEAALTQQAAQSQHPTAHLAGEIAGIFSPIALERGLAAAGVKVAPTAIGAAVRGIKSLPARALAKTALNTATGAGYAAAQAAGRTEGGLTPRLAAAKQAAVPGAIAGAVLPLGLAALGAAGARVLKPVAERLAGKAPVAAEAAPSLLTPATRAALEERIARPTGGPLEDIAGAQADLAAGKITPQDFNTAMELASRGVNRPPVMNSMPILPQLRAQADPMEAVPAFVRNARPVEVPPSGLLPYYPRGGATEQILNPAPAISPMAGNPQLPMDQLKLLLGLPADQFEAAAAMFPEEIVQQVRTLRGGLLQPALP
jgi:hypothetical protein